MKRLAGVVLAALLSALALASPDATAQEQPRFEVVLSGENNRLNAYDADTGEKRTVVPSAADDPAGIDINAEICFVPDGVSWKPDGEVWFIAGEDTEQNTEAGVIKQGWGIFRLTGTTLATLAAEEIGKLVPDSFVTTADNPENYGCGVLPDGRVITGDVGDQLPQQPATGQLIVWFLDASQLVHIGPDPNDFARVPHCKIDVAIGTAGGIEVDGTDVYLASNRPDLTGVQAGGIYRYDSTVWPTGEDAAGGCGRTDATGEQLADADKVGKSLFIPQAASLTFTPSDIVDSGRGTFYVSSVFTGTVAEYGRDGIFRRFVVATTGQLGGITPFGLGVAEDGTLWIADIGVEGPGPAAGAGSVVRVRFDEAGNPGDPEVIDEGLEFPDGIGIRVLAAGQVAAPPSTPSGPSGPGVTTAPSTTATTVASGSVGTTSGTGGLARTGGPTSLPLVAAAAAAVALALVDLRRRTHRTGGG